jgi:protein-L-isoaspartate(D-aspartate) O-methyltransferase
VDGPEEAGERDATDARRRAAMVERQLRRRGIGDERVLAVMGELPREAFVPESEHSIAYDDSALPIAAGQTISQPYMVARMTELLDVTPGDRILEIGTGSGYQAAILARLGAEVVSYERQAALVATARARLAAVDLGPGRVEVRAGDGSLGDPDGGPWDGIIVTAAAPAVPGALRDQLRVGARLVIPVGSRLQQDLIVVERTGPNDWRETSDGACVFVPLVGAGGWEA